MPFFTPDSFDAKLAKKCFDFFVKLDRVKEPHPDKSDIRCLLCDDSPLLSANFIFCTDETIFYREYQTYGLCRYDFSAVSAVTTELKHSFPCVCLTVSNGEKSTLYVAARDVGKMVDYIKGKISRPAAVSSAVISPADEIMKYKNLLDCGAITAEEFEAKKGQLLGL